MSFDDDPMDLLEDDGDGVNEMGLFFDDDENKHNAQKSPQEKGCSVILLCIGSGALSAGLLITKLIA